MFWAGTIFGIFIGANIGVIMSGLLISAKYRSRVQPAGSKRNMQSKIKAQNQYSGSHRPLFSK